jgi:hypothetical protein
MRKVTKVELLRDIKRLEAKLRIENNPVEMSNIAIEILSLENILKNTK